MFKQFQEKINGLGIINNSLSRFDIFQNLKANKIKEIKNQQETFINEICTFKPKTLGGKILYKNSAKRSTSNSSIHIRSALTEIKTPVQIISSPEPI